MSASATDQLINVPAHLAAEAYMTAARAAGACSRTAGGGPHLDAIAHLAPMGQRGVAAAMLPLS